MFADYYKEREGFDYVETDKGFATFKITGEECYIKDIFIKKEHRRSGEAFKIGDIITEMAKINGCKYLTGSVVPSLAGSTESLMLLLKYGFRLLKSDNDFIVLIKEI